MTENEYDTVKRTLDEALGDVPPPDVMNRHKNDTIVRYWKHKEEGTIVEILKYEYVDAVRRRVVFTHPAWGFSTSAWLSDFEKEYEPYKNRTDRI